MNTQQQLNALQEKINETESIDGKISKLANSSFVFWHDLSIEDVEILLSAGYNMNDFAGRVSINDSLVRWNMHITCDCGRQMNIKRVSENMPIFHCKHCDQIAIDAEKTLIQAEINYNRM